jgi:hypothetical protein
MLSILVCMDAPVRDETAPTQFLPLNLAMASAEIE